MWSRKLARLIFHRGAVLVCAVAMAGGCSKAPGENASKKSSADRQEASTQAREVEAVQAQMRPIERVVTATGSLLAQERSILSAKVAGRLQQLNVDIGTEVKKGDLLAQIDPRDYELGVQQALAALAQARASVGLPAFGTNDSRKAEEVSAVKRAQAVFEEASKNRERIRSLSTSGIASTSELDTVEAAYAVASTSYGAAVEEVQGRIAAIAERRADLRLAEKRNSDASLRAPFDGIVQSRPANIGEYVAAGTPTVELVKSNPLRLRLQVPERDAALIQLGQLTRFSITGDTNVYTCWIERMSPALDEDSRMLFVEANVPGAGSLRPGLFVRAQVVVAENERALCVPKEAVVTFAGIEKVVLAEAGKAREMPISTGRRQEGFVEVLEGLKVGQEVILNPGALRTGAPVLVKSGEARSGNALGTASAPKR